MGRSVNFRDNPVRGSYPPLRPATATTARTSVPAAGPTGVACRIGATKQPPERATLDARLAQALSAALSKARSSVSGLAGATPKRAKKLEKAADTALKRLNTAAKKRTIDEGCTGALLIANLRGQIGAL